MEGGQCCTEVKQKKRGQHQEKSTTRYKGIRMRKGGRWVAESREPNKRSRIWLGSYATAIAAALAYDTAVFYLRGPSARLNFPELIFQEDGRRDVSSASIRKKANEVGARVDALQAASDQYESNHSSRFSQKPDLNKFPESSNHEED